MQFAGIRVKCEVEMSSAQKNVEYFPMSIRSFLKLGILVGVFLITVTVIDDIIISNS